MWIFRAGRCRNCPFNRSSGELFSGPCYTGQYTGEINRLTLEQRTIPAGTQVQVLELDNVSVKTGDLHLLGDYAQGNGTLISRGDAQIRIINNSPTFLRINDLEIAHREGGIFF